MIVELNRTIFRNTTMYSLGRTSTFRAGSGKILSRWGGNLQNVDKKIRRMYVPSRKGFKLGQCDQSGAEALVVAYLCRPGKFRDLFINGVKPHVYVALHMFKDEWKKVDPSLDIDGACLLMPKELKSYPQWKAIDKLIKSSDDWPSERRFYYFAKQCCHSSNYGIMPPTFCLNVLEKSGGTVVIPVKEGTKMLDFYRVAMFPEIPEWNREIEQIVRMSRTLYNLFGHPRHFNGYKMEPSFFQEAFAFIPQSTVGEITHRAFRNLYNYIATNKRDWTLLGNCHDSYLMEFPEEEEQEACNRMKEFMEQEMTSPKDGTVFRMKSEVATGWNWAPYKEGKNDRGLREVSFAN